MNEEFIACPWCGQRNPPNALSCVHCGGPLPVYGDDPGPEPPPPPRTLPKGYKKRVMFKNTPVAWIGAIFVMAGLLTICSFSLIGLFAGVLLMAVISFFVGGVFILIGAPMAYMGYQSALGKIRPYEYGIQTLGEITEIYRDTSTEVNGRNPWAVAYIYQVGNESFEGVTTTWKYAPKMVASGDHVHVLYLPEDPQQSVLYPPLG